MRGAPAPAAEGPYFAHIDQTWGRSEREPSPMVSVTDGSYRLIRRAGDVPAELFDLSTDRSEQVDLASEKPEVLTRMIEFAETYLAQEPAEWAGDSDVEISPQELEQLRALGYQVE